MGIHSTSVSAFVHFQRVKYVSANLPDPVDGPSGAALSADGQVHRHAVQIVASVHQGRVAFGYPDRCSNCIANVGSLAVLCESQCPRGLLIEPVGGHQIGGIFAGSSQQATAPIGGAFIERSQIMGV